MNHSTGTNTSCLGIFNYYLILTTFDMGLFDRSTSRASNKRSAESAIQDGRPSFHSIVHKHVSEHRRQESYDPWKHYTTPSQSTELPSLPCPSSDPFVEKTVRKQRSVLSLRSANLQGGERKKLSKIPRSSSDTIRPVGSLESPTKKSARPQLTSRISSPSLSIFPRASTPLSSLAESATYEPRGSMESAGRAFVQGQEKFAKHLRESGHRLKHSASKLSLLSTVSNVNEIEEAKPRPALRSPCRTHGQRNCACKREIACSITEPAEFKHVTHAAREQFKNIATRSQNDLIADFSVMRAAQRPCKDLNGIVAEEIPASTRCSLDATSVLQTTPTRRQHIDSALPSPVPSLSSTCSDDSLQSSRPDSSISNDSPISRRPSCSFSRPFPDGRPPKVSHLATRASYDSVISASSPTYHDRFGKPYPKRKPSMTLSGIANSDTDSVFTCSEPSTPADINGLSALDTFPFQFVQAFESGLSSVEEVDDAMAVRSVPPQFIEVYRTKALPPVPSVERQGSLKLESARPIRLRRVPVTLRHTGSLPVSSARDSAVVA